MRTVCGVARQVQRLFGSGGLPVVPVAEVRPPPGGRTPLVTDRIGEQRRAGARLDQVDGTTCGSAVLVALAAWADPNELARLDGSGFGARYDARQKQVHGETNRLWPQAMGTTPWAMAQWMRRNVAAAGLYRVRLVDDVSFDDVAHVVAAVDAALVSGRPVPLLVGQFVPRHYVLALGGHEGGWRVYEPSSGSVRVLDPARTGARTLAPVLGFDRLHAALLPT
ncbi:MAG: hypothetical protein ACRDRK_05030 [Pseudonocardia sp.]